MRVSAPIFSEKKKKNDCRNDCLNVRCSIDKNLWKSFKTLISLRGLDVKDVLEKIIKNWVINFGKVTNIEEEFLCSNCGEIVDNNNCFIFIKDSYKIFYCKDCEINNSSLATHLWYR
jgi:late competence protein required for DNA uptake (superfamily II DNA/RNA helicase)